MCEEGLRVESHCGCQRVPIFRKEGLCWDSWARFQWVSSSSLSENQDQVGDSVESGETMN